MRREPVPIHKACMKVHIPSQTSARAMCLRNNEFGFVDHKVGSGKVKDKTGSSTYKGKGRRRKWQEGRE